MTQRKIRNGFAWIDYCVIDDKNVTGSDILIYLVLARHADNTTQQCRPGIQRIMKESRLTKPTVLKSISRLEQFGYISVNRTAGKVNIYTLLEPNQSKNFTGGGKKECLEGVKNSTPNNTHINNTDISKDISKEVYDFKSKLSKLIQSDKDVNNIIGVYWKTVGMSFPTQKTFNDGYKREVRSATLLKDYSDEDIRKTFAYLKTQSFKWTLETVLKYIPNINNLKK